MSDPAIVKLSRNFVCARLLTYESADEAKFLTSIFRGRTGELENTVFAMFAPDATTQLCRPGRSPAMVFGHRDTVRGLKAAMEDAVKRHPGNMAARESHPAVPYHMDVRRGLAAAAADIRPLVVVYDAKDDAGVDDAALGKLIWGEQFAGRFSVARAGDSKALAGITGAIESDGVMVVAPNDFGTGGTVVASGTDLAPEALRAVLAKGLEAYRPPDKAWHRLIREGRRKGIAWKTAIPVTGPDAKRHQERGGDRRGR